MSKWQPIGTFDYNSDDIVDVLTTNYDLSGRKKYRRFVNVYYDGKGFVVNNAYIRGVTHWTPLLKMPKE